MKYTHSFLVIISVFFFASCTVVRNTNNDPHFDDEGYLIKDSSDLVDTSTSVSKIKFYVEVSGSMNGFFRRSAPNRFKKDVWEICKYFSYVAPDINILTDNGDIGETMSMDVFRGRMNTGSFVSQASTKVPVMIETILSSLDSDNGEVAVLISDMKYSPVGTAAPQVLLTQYSTDISSTFGKYRPAICLVCATSEYIDRAGGIACASSPYYYLIMGKEKNVALIRDCISTLLSDAGSYIDNIESGFKYGNLQYEFGRPNKCSRFEKEPTFETYEETDDNDTCTIRLKIDIAPYRWILTNKAIFRDSFKAKSLYGTQLEIRDIIIDVKNVTNRELIREATATVAIKVFDMPTESEVIEWTLDLPDTRTELFMPFFNAIDENDITKSYSIEGFIHGMFHGGVVNNELKPNYILVTKKG